MSERIVPDGFRLVAQRNFEWSRHILLTGWARGGKNNLDCARLVSMTFEKVTEENDGTPCPPFPIDDTAAQVLMDSLWDCGIRPTNGAGTAGAMAAAQANLEDMRKINTKLLDAVVGVMGKVKP